MLTAGIDLCEINRIKRSMRNPRFCREILGDTEFTQLQERGFPAQSVAASFSAKEAFGKAMGTGLSGFAMREAELLRKPDGRPYLHLSGQAEKLAADWDLTVSVTHTNTAAAAVVIGESKKQ